MITGIGRSYRTAFDYANWVLITLVILWTTVFFFFEVFACGTTPAASWTSLYSLRHACIDTFSMQTACAVFNWIMDLAILIEPLLMVRNCVAVINVSVHILLRIFSNYSLDRNTQYEHS